MIYHKVRILKIPSRQEFLPFHQPHNKLRNLWFRIFFQSEKLDKWAKEIFFDWLQKCIHKVNNDWNCIFNANKRNYFNWKVDEFASRASAVKTILKERKIWVIKNSPCILFHNIFCSTLKWKVIQMNCNGER